MAAFCLVASLIVYLPFAHGLVRIFDFPRLQLVVLSLIIALTAWLVAMAYFWPILAMALASFCIQAWHIARFTPLWPWRSADFTGDFTATPIIRLVVCNVKQSNRQFEAVACLIHDNNADIGVFLETNQEWVDRLQSIDTHTHHWTYPANNTYGMCLISKFPLKDAQTRFLLNPEVPSFDMTIIHPMGQSFRLISVHPEPPIPIDDTLGRDAEIGFVGKLVRHDDTPVIVTGDLNDVAWSRTTRRFLRLSRLLDPREGRGLYNSFDARFFLFRWPLDHIFHSPHFQLVSMRRLPFVGSDHFPMFYELALTAQQIAHQRMDAAQAADIEETDKAIAIEKRRNRRPIGHNWEN